MIRAIGVIPEGESMEKGSLHRLAVLNRVSKEASRRSHLKEKTLLIWRREFYTKGKASAKAQVGSSLVSSRRPLWLVWYLLKPNTVNGTWCKGSYRHCRYFGFYPKGNKKPLEYLGMTRSKGVTRSAFIHYRGPGQKLRHQLEGKV